MIYVIDLIVACRVAVSTSIEPCHVMIFWKDGQTRRHQQTCWLNVVAQFVFQGHG